MTDWVITNAEMINEGRRLNGKVRIRGGRTERIDSSLSAEPGEHGTRGTRLGFER